MHVNITEGTRSRIQVFQGFVLGRSGDGVRETFTVRKISFQVGVERTFPVHTPVIDHIEVVTRGDVRRAKLYYLRNLRGKKAKIKEKRGPESSRRPARVLTASPCSRSIVTDSRSGPCDVATENRPPQPPWSPRGPRRSVVRQRLRGVGPQLEMPRGAGSTWCWVVTTWS